MSADQYQRARRYAEGKPRRGIRFGYLMVAWLLIVLVVGLILPVVMPSSGRWVAAAGALIVVAAMWRQVAQLLRRHW